MSLQDLLFRRQVVLKSLRINLLFLSLGTWTSCKKIQFVFPHIQILIINDGGLLDTVLCIYGVLPVVLSSKINLDTVIIHQ